jgi:hypothetical protein
MAKKAGYPGDAGSAHSRTRVWLGYLLERN